MKPLYTAIATATEGRDGHARSSDGVIDIDLSIPKAMGGPGKEGATNPEQLFACGYAACFGGAIGFLARMDKKPLKHIEVTAEVTIGAKDGGGFELAVALKVRLPELARPEAEALVTRAHQVCPYSNATRGNIEVTLAVVD
jgi:Ohr subfamily peroxiredoxin